VLIGAGFGAGFAYLQFSQQQQASHELLISNQVAKGFEQLGSDKDVVRLGGIYALEGVMNTSEQYHCAKLQGADLRGAELIHADLSGANLAEADLSSAHLERADPS
jgi:uncharacterized protein YjbI with pentapeptide repeats